MSLLKYTGTLSVGCLDIMLGTSKPPADTSVETLCQSELGALIRVYYPAQTREAPKATCWAMDAPLQQDYLDGITTVWKLNFFLKKFVNYCKNVFLPIDMHAPLASYEEWKAKANVSMLGGLPVIVFSHGLVGARNVYSTFCGQLASEGFLVLAVEHADGSAICTHYYDETKKQFKSVPHIEASLKDDAEITKYRYVQVEKRSKEVIKALEIAELLNSDPSSIKNILSPHDFDMNSFKGRLDLSSPAVIGHSFGGATIIDVLNKQPKFKCGLGLDVWFTALEDNCYEQTGDQPTLLIYTGTFLEWEGYLQKAHRYIRSKPEDSTEMLTIKGAFHYDQSDVPGLVPRILHPLWRGVFKGRISYDDAIYCQRKLISDYLVNRLTAKDERPVFDEHYELPYKEHVKILRKEELSNHTKE